MKTRLSIILVLVASLTLLLAWNVSAQGPDPHGPHGEKPVRVVTPRAGSPGMGALPSSRELYPPKLPPSPAISAQALPTSVDLTSHMPPVGNQGSQGSCVAWSTGYYYKSFHEGLQQGWSLVDNNHQFSPAFLFNQRLNNKCQIDQGWYIGSAMEMLQQKGDVSIASFPYNADDSCTQPTSAQLQTARTYRAANFGAFFINDRDNVGYYSNDLTPLKQHLASGNMIVFAIPIYDEFYELDNSSPSTSCMMDVPSSSSDIWGSHAIAIVGYDDAAQRFKLRNSWGTNWGCNGDAYLTYDFVRDYVHEAWWMTDITKDTTSLVYLPIINRASSSGTQPSLYGQITQSGTPAQAVVVGLTKWVDADDGWYGYSMGKTQTDASGIYRFSGLSTLKSNETYQVWYLNETRTPGRLWRFGCNDVETYSAGTNKHACDFDVADISLGQPNGSDVYLPTTFYWTRRAGQSNDDYELNIYDKWGYEWWYTDPSLGYVNHYTLSELPDELWGGDYYWDLWFYTPAGYGWTLGANKVTIEP
jgi:C1A family cysteine protease